MSESNEIPNPSRRKFLIGSAAAAITAALGGVALWEAKTKLDSEPSLEMDLSLENLGIRWAPDVHVSYVTLPDNKRAYFFSGNGGNTYRIEGTPEQELKEIIKKPASFEHCWGPQYFSHDKYGYSAIGSVLQADENNPNHLTAFTHNEQHKGQNYIATFTASIQQIESFDGGRTWKDIKSDPVIKGDDPMEPGIDVSGAGQPCAIIKDGHAYLYYTDWSRKNALHPDQIYLARGEIINGSVDKFKFYTENGFSDEESDLKPVIIPSNDTSKYAALPSISWNTSLNKYIGVFETDTGFDITKSDDGITWEPGSSLYRFKTPHSQGGLLESYPTLLSPDAPSDQITNSETILLYAKGDPHNLVSRPVKI